MEMILDTERLGFVREGRLKENVWFRKDEDGNPIWKDTYVYGMVNHGCV